MISVIVVSFNTRELLKKCLASLCRHEPDAEIIVVDNASVDGSVVMVRSDFKTVRVIESVKNLGFAAANNLGLAVATGPIIVLLNSDTELFDNSLTKCANRFPENRCLGAVHPNLIGADGQPQRCEYPLPTFSEAARVAFRRSPRLNPKPGQSWLVGTALVLNRSALDSVGGKLDEDYFIYWEDCDLSARLRRAGWELAVEQSAVVRHVGGASGGGADANRRRDLNLWFWYGKHRWFRCHRPIVECFGMWVLDALEVPRRLFRGLIRPGMRRTEWRNAGTIARVLLMVACGRQPPRETGRK